MSGGISPNKLNDISKVYLDMVTDINKKEQEADAKRWTQKEETGCKTESPFKKKKIKESDITDPDVKDSKYQREDYESKKKKEVLAAMKKQGRKLSAKDKNKIADKVVKDKGDTSKSDDRYAYESFSNWRETLREVTSDAEVEDTVDQNVEKVKEKKVKNKIIINPQFKEAVEEMGGELLEVTEVEDDPKSEKMAKTEKKLKLRLLRTKMMAVKQGADDSINAGYEPTVSAIKKLVNERLGGKGYSRKATKGGGDWPDSDRGAGNKAKKRAGGKVEKKSPTYLAHVHNKEEVEVQEKVLDKFETGEKERIVKGMKKDSKGLKKRYGKDWKSVMYATATKRAKEAGDTSKSDKRYAHEEVEVVDELNRYGKETGKATGSLNKRAGTPIKKGGDEPGALRNVRGMIRKETGKPEGQKRSDYDARGRGQDRREKPSHTIERIRRMRKDAEKLMRDTSGT